MQSENLKNLISEQVPENSGIYQFFGAENDVLYIGKAKNLRKRLMNYTVANRLSARIARMIFLAQKVEFIQTNSELEALLLEHNLIKKFEPRFNILLRDDKSFPLIAIDKIHDYGRIFKHRGLKDNNNYYFGPFASAGDVNRVIDVMKKSFLLRSCSDQEFKSRKKPCMEYQIKRCSAPCVDYISKQDYKKSISDAVDFLSGKSSHIQSVLADKMQNLSNLQEYEKASAIRDRIRSLSSIQAKQNINLSDITDKDIISLVEKNHQYCIYISFYRGGNNYGSKPYFYGAQDDLEKEEFLSKFLGQFYLNQVPPKNILLNLKITDHDLMQDFLSKLAEEKISISTPKLGHKLNLIKDQEDIAKQVLKRHIEQNIRDKELLVELKNVFNLSVLTDRIEVYDNSHTANQNAVGCLICAGPNGFIKNGYRKFNIRFEDVLKKDNKKDDIIKTAPSMALHHIEKINGADIATTQTDYSQTNFEYPTNSLTSQIQEAPKIQRDDTAMMKEMLYRRFKSSSGSMRELPMPDFIIIDGGLPQLSAAQEVFDELRIKIPFICMSKGPNRNAGEEFFHQTGRESFQLKKGSPLAFYLQRLRDEAHRFAITAHRAKRQKTVTKSGLDEVKDIGVKRKKALLNHFGSLDKIKAATIDDLMRVEGISKATASKIWAFFR